jgi:Outer membrane protein beta-barrel domain
MKQLIIALGALSLLSASLQAQKAPLAVQTQGVTLGGSTLLALGFTISGPGILGEIRTDNGRGVGIQIGYGVTPRIMLFGTADLAQQGSSFQGLEGKMGLAHLEVGGRLVASRAGRRAVPYVSAQYGLHALAARSVGDGLAPIIRLYGEHFGGGAGVLYALTPALALDAGVVASRGKFGKVELTRKGNTAGDVDVNSSTTMRFKVGFNWHP